MFLPTLIATTDIDQISLLPLSLYSKMEPLCSMMEHLRSCWSKKQGESYHVGSCQRTYSIGQLSYCGYPMSCHFLLDPKRWQFIMNRFTWSTRMVAQGFSSFLLAFPRWNFRRDNIPQKLVKHSLDLKATCFIIFVHCFDLSTHCWCSWHQSYLRLEEWKEMEFFV